MKRHILTTKHLRLSLSRALAALCLALPGAALAANYTWCGAGEDGMWTNSANWLLNGTWIEGLEDKYKLNDDGCSVYIPYAMITADSLGE